MSDTNISWEQNSNCGDERKTNNFLNHPIDECIQKSSIKNPTELRQGIIFDNVLASANIIIPSHFEGYPGVAHGGIIAMLMDEVMGYAFRGRYSKHALTIRLSITYIEPAPLNELLLVEARVAKESAAPNKQVIAEILNHDRRCFASASGIFTAMHDPYKYAS